jgi:hypothetical protein
MEELVHWFIANENEYLIKFCRLATKIQSNKNTKQANQKHIQKKQ